jgi:hypothetical protein
LLARKCAAAHLKKNKALARFLTKKGTEEHVRVGRREVLIGPTFYKERMNETKRLVNEIRKSN